MKQYYCYILSNRRYGALYVGVTNNIIARVSQHKSKQVEGFTEKYNIDRLVWFEVHENIESAINREKQLKKWNRKWKTELIEAQNLLWDDLYPMLLGS